MFLLFIKLRMYTRICVFYTWHENNEFFYCVFKPKKKFPISASFLKRSLWMFEQYPFF